MPPREEKLIEGIWHWRYDGDEIWTPMSQKMLAEWIIELKKSLDLVIKMSEKT